MQVAVVRLLCQSCSLVNVASAKLPAGSGNEIVDSLLRLDSFVNVIVTGQHDVHAVLQKDWLHHLSQLVIRSVLLRRRIRRVMEETDLPLRSLSTQLVFEPLHLFLVHVVAIQREDAHVFQETFRRSQIAIQADHDQYIPQICTVTPDCWHIAPVEQQFPRPLKLQNYDGFLGLDLGNRPTLVDDLMAVIEDSGLEEVVLVGHSVGGVIAGVVMGIISALISAPISAIVFGGVTGSGTDLLVAAFQQAGSDLQTAVLQQGLLSDPIDKVITNKPIIKVPGCPPIAEVMTGVVTFITTFGKLPELADHRL